MNDLPESILANLADADPAVRLAAVSALGKPPILPAALFVLGRMAIHDPDAAVRSAAMLVLRGEGARAAYANQALTRETRLGMVQQIERWQLDGLITREQGEVLRLRYGYDIQPAPIPHNALQHLAKRIQLWTDQSLITPDQASSLAASLPPQPAAPKSAAPVSAHSTEQAAVAPVQDPASSAKEPRRQSAPAPSLSQILFSETSIRIALFLGGFLVVAAALILAALVEVARLPVLLGLAAVSGVGALVARKRLPLPSFVLYIIFASLLPILARVLVDMLHLTGAASDSYWSAAWLLLAIALAVGTRLYASRLMSFAALGGLVATAFELSALVLTDWRAFGLFLALAAVIGALGSAALSRWKDFRFALPLYLGSHFVVLVALLYTFMRTLGDLLENTSDLSPRVWLVYALAWAAGAAFYAVSDRLVRRFALLPYLAAGALLFFPWTFLQGLDPSQMLMAWLLAAAGGLYALGGAVIDHLAHREGFLVRYGKPLMFGAPLLFIWAAPFALDADILAGLILLVVAAVVMTVLNITRQRRWAWSVALLFWLAAYFVLFEQPFMERLDLSLLYIVLAPGLLLLTPEFFPFSAEAEKRWRVPARWLGLVVLGLLAFSTVIVAFPGSASEQREGAIVFTVTAVFFLALALRRGLPRVAVVTTVLLPIALMMLLTSLEADHWLPWLAGLAILFYAVGWVLREEFGLWSDVFRLSGLGLGFVLIFFLPMEHDLLAGLSVLAAGLLFLVELLFGPRSKLSPWLEVPMDIVLVAALFGLLEPLAKQAEQQAWALGMLLAALIVLGFDLFRTRTATGQQNGSPAALRWGARIAGITLAVISLVFTIAAKDLPWGWGAAIFAISAGYALLAARVYPLPRLGYAMIGYLALALFFLLRTFDQEIWLAPEIALAALLYAGSFLFDRPGTPQTGTEGEVGAVVRAPTSPWSEVLRYGGLALALLVPLTAPLEDTGLWASLWVSCAATLHAVEAFRRRSVWWGFPTDALYLLAYFLLLVDLNVDQPQFFSTAVAALGMLQHYLLIRTGSRVGAFITGMVSQLVLLGTTYAQMVETEQLGYFVLLFFQGLAVLVYGIILRSRSLVITPLVFIVLGVMTVVLSILSGVPTAIIIGCTGILLLTLGILAVVLRERLVEASEKMGGWRA